MKNQPTGPKTLHKIDPVDKALSYIEKLGRDMNARRYVKFLEDVVAALQDELEEDSSDGDDENDEEEDEDEPELPEE